VGYYTLSRKTILQYSYPMPFWRHYHCNSLHDCLWAGKVLQFLYNSGITGHV